MFFTPLGFVIAFLRAGKSNSQWALFILNAVCAGASYFTRSFLFAVLACLRSHTCEGCPGL